MTQVAHADIASNVTASTIPTLDPNLLERIGQQGDIALAVINAEVTRQALFIAYLDDFWLMMWVTLAALPLVFNFMHHDHNDIIIWTAQDYALEISFIPVCNVIPNPPTSTILPC